MKKSIAIILVLLVFALGAAAGLLGAKWFIEYRMHYALSSPKALAEVVTIRMSAELGLDGDQRRQLAPIVDETRRDLLKLRAQVQPQLEEIFTHSEGKIRALLRPDQQKHFDELVRLRKEHWAKPRTE
ncbi:MAG: hypothetical protein FJ388_07175 [Verrucomicrobia bacterium]|nr:hypothetical protein [Verrucomicrobiota bacterium]